MPAIEVINPGLATMIQGRPFRGRRYSGLALCGAADVLSFALANWLTENPAQTPALETAYAPFAFRAHAPLTIAVQGATRQISLNGAERDPYSSFTATKGDVIALSAATTGCRSYIAVQGGFCAEELLGGNSTYLPARLGGSANVELCAGAILPVESHITGSAKTRSLPQQYRLQYGAQFILRIIAGPEYDWLDHQAKTSLSAQKWRISARGDRIGQRLEGDAIKVAPMQPLDSSAVFPGTIQCPPSGLPFLLGPDAQTTGGYPRIAQIIRADRHVIGQLRPDATVTLQMTKAAEARGLYRSKLSMLQKIQPDIRLD